MKRLLILPLFLFLFTDIKAQTALAAQEVRHSSFVATPDPTIDSWLLVQVSRNASFTDLVVDGVAFSSFYAQNPTHVNSPLRIKNLDQNTTYYYRFAYDDGTPDYANSVSVTTWDPPESPVLKHPEISTYEITLEWESDDPDVTGFEIWVYGISGCPTSGGTYIQDNILSAGANDRSLTYDFVFFDEATYRFDIYAMNADGEYGDADVVSAFSCICYESYDLSTLNDDYGLSLSWNESNGRLAVNSYFEREVEGEILPGTFFSSSSGGQAINQYLNWEWTITGNWEIDYSAESKRNIVFLTGSGTGTFSVQLVDPCTGAASPALSYAIKDDQAISFGGLPAKSFGDPDFSLSATASSGLPVTYSSSDESVATISGSTVSILSAGSTTITASQAGNEMYNPADDVQQTLTVNKADQIISFGALDDIKYSDDPLILSATSSSGLIVSYSSSDESIVEIVNGNEANPVGVGTVTITASQSGNTDYNSAPSVDQGLTVLKGDQSIDFDAINGSYNVNNSGFTLNATASSGLSVTFSSSDESVATISGSWLNIEGAGTTTITASQSGNSLYNPAAEENQQLLVSKLNQTVNVPDLSGNTYTYGLSASPIQVTTDSGLESMDFESSDENIFTIQNISNAGGGVFYVTLGIVGAGTATFTATQPGNETYESDVASSIVHVSKANQTITFPQPDPVFYGDPNFELLATSNSGLNVTYSSSNPEVATIAGATVSILSAGETTITASQMGNENYNPAAEVLKDLTVMKLTQTIQFDTDLPSFATFGDGPYSFGVTASSGLPVTFEIDDENVLSIENGVATIVGAGTVIVTANQAGNQNYHPKEGAISLEVDKASQSITFNSIEPKKFDDDPFTLNATASSGLQVTYTSADESVATISGSEVMIHNVGSTLITALQSGDDNYHAAGQKTQTLTVDKANQEIVFDEITDQDLGATISLSALASSGLPVSFSISGPAILDGNELTTTSAGTVMVTASQDGNSFFNAAADVVRSFQVVDKDPQTISFSPIEEKTFGDDPFNLSATTTSGLAITFASSNQNIATITDNTVTIHNAGTTTIIASQPGDDQYHPAEDVQQTLTVNKLGQAISFELGSDAAKVYGDNPFSLVANATSGLPIEFASSNSTIAAIDDESVEIYMAGTVNITASQSGNQNYHAAEDIVQTLVISKADQEIVFEPNFIEDQPLSGNSTTLDIYGNPSGLGALSVAILNGPATIAEIGPDFYEVTFTGAGEIVIGAEISETENYASSSDELAFTVFDDTKLNQTIVFDPLEEKTFGDANFNLSGTSSSGLEVVFQSSDESVASVSASEVTIIGAGTATITATQAGNEDYNAASPVARELIVNKADQVISFDEIGEKNTSDADFSLSATSTSGLVVNYSSSNEGIATVTGNVVSIVDAGSTVITAFQPGNANYNQAESVDQTLIVKLKVAQEITFESIPVKTFGDDDFDVIVSASSGLAVETVSSNTDVATISGNTISIVGAGTTTITASQPGDEEYNAATSISRELVVNKADQTISFTEPEEKTFGDESFDLEVSASSGLSVEISVLDESVAVLDGQTITIMNAGSTNIIASQAGNENFNAASSINRTLTVQKAPQVITFNPSEIGDLDLDSDDFFIQVSNSSGLTPEVTSNDKIELSEGPNAGEYLVSLQSSGDAVITATHPGSTNYLATQESLTFGIGKLQQEITFEVLPEKTYGDEPFEVSVASSSGLAVTLASSNVEVATVEGFTVTIVGAGTATLTASQSGDDTYSAANEISQELIVLKADQIITFDEIVGSFSIGDVIELSASASSELAVTFEIEGPAALDGSSLSISDQGIVTITASQSGDSNWNAAESVALAIEIAGSALGVSEESVSIYPNPFMNKLYFNHSEKVDVRIFGMNGSLVWSKSKVRDSIDLRELDEGMYILEVVTAEDLMRLRIRKVN